MLRQSLALMLVLNFSPAVAAPAVAAPAVAAPAIASPAIVSPAIVSPAVATERGWGSGTGYFVVHHAPDPVNVQNGNFFLPVQDLFLPCYGFPLEIQRAYNSVSTEVGAFGMGWSFNYAVHISVSPGAEMVVIEPDGFINRYTPVQSDTIQPELVEKIVAAKQAEDTKYAGQAKKAKIYEELRQKLSKDVEFYQRQRQLYLPQEKTEWVSGKYESNQRGHTFLYRKADGYERHTSDGQIEYYGKSGALQRVRDRHGNELTMKYEQDRLQQVNDSCGQQLTFKYNNHGRIVTIKDNLLRTLTYTYDNEERMSSSRGLDGELVQYQYEPKSQRMQLLVFADKSSTKIIYDADNGKVIRQEGPGKKITHYTYSKRGIGYESAEVKDNEEGYLKYEFFPKENKTVYTDKNQQKTISIMSSCCNQPLSVTNAKGEGDFFKYNDFGQVTEKNSTGGLLTSYTYEPRFRQVETVTTPDSVTTRYQYDGQGNLTLAKNSKDESLKLSYNSRGKIIAATDQLGQQMIYDYNQQGRPTLVQMNMIQDGKEKVIGEMRLTYKPNGDLNTIKYVPDNPKIIEKIRQALTSHMRLLTAAGVSFEI